MEDKNSAEGHRARRRQHREGVRQGLDHAPQGRARPSAETSRSSRRARIGLDIALGIGGYPRGRIIEIYGPESSGKTTLTLHAIASVQKQGGVAAFIDAEHALDPATPASSA